MSVFVHEINQPLTAIMAYSHCCLLLIKNKRDFDALLVPIENMARQARHAGDTLTAIRDLIQDGTFNVQETCLNAIIRDSMAVLGDDLLGFKLNITLNLANALPTIHANKLHMMRIILNLARNSVEALQGATRVNPKPSINTRVSNGHVVVCVRDNGPGIPAELQSKILDTHFTTKPHGMGIGLSVCQFLIKAHGGQLCIQENGSRGAWFSFTLPIKPLDENRRLIP